MKKSAKKELLVVDDSNVVASAVFEFKKLMMDDTLVWTMQLILKTTLPQSYREYSLKFGLNESPFTMRIGDLERKKEVVKMDSQEDLFPSEGAKKTQLKRIDDEIEEIKIELEDALRNTPVIEFDAVINKLEYKNGQTVVVFSVPSEVVKELDQVKSIFSNYKVDLIRE